MRLNTILAILFTPLLASIASPLISAHPDPTALAPRRLSSLLNDLLAQPKLPTPSEAGTEASREHLNLSNIQGDVLIGMKKKQELFYFFSITDVALFKSKLGSDIHPRITSTTQMLDVRQQPLTSLNVAFSQSGLTTLGINDPLGDPAFAGGQFQDASSLGDPGTQNWVDAFAGTAIHGVFLLASDKWSNIQAEWGQLNNTLNQSITAKYSLQGGVRPGSEEGHEHFGFMDGIGQPAIKGFVSSPAPGQALIDPGHILLSETGDTVTRPPWAKDSSFLAFRQLKQLVPEFNQFLAHNPILEGGLTRAEGSALLGARMIGRWKSGTPVDLSPRTDNPSIAANPNEINNFDFSHPHRNLSSDQTNCPFSAHIRKTRPRADLNPVNTVNHIIRAGIPYGAEVTLEENAKGSTRIERGLAFVAYQSNLDNGFRFLQQKWANNPKFIFGKSDPTPGVDPIIGALAGAQRPISGLDPTNPDRDITLVQDFVVSRGGEYFLCPSLSAIAGTFAV